MSEDKIRTVMILEMLGRPADYAKEIMVKVVDAISKEKGVELIKKSISAPKQIENSNLFSLFAEIELDVENINQLFGLIFAYMPSHVDIITPENLKVSNSDLNMFANQLVIKLHQYDEIAKTITMERNILKEQLVKKEEKPVELSEIIGKKEKINKANKTGKKRGKIKNIKGKNKVKTK